MTKEEKLYVNGQVIGALPKRHFKIRLENRKDILGYLPNKTTKNSIRVTIGNWVRVKLLPHDMTRGRIVFQYSKRP